MRDGEFASCSAASPPRMRPNASWVDRRRPRGTGSSAGTGDRRRVWWLRAAVAARTAPRRGTRPARSGGMSRPANFSHSAPSGTAIALLERRHLLRVHQPGMVVLVAGEGQAVALDRVGDKAGRLVVGDGVERVEHRAQIVPGEVGHQPRQRRRRRARRGWRGCRDGGSGRAADARASPRRPCRPAPNRASSGRRRSIRADARRPAARRRPAAAGRISA